MSSNTMIIIFLFNLWILFSITNTFTTNYFNRKIWFDDGNIFHIHQEQFWTVFQQHRNVNRHINWLTNEISSINDQIKSVKNHLSLVLNTREQHVKIEEKHEDQIDNIPLPPIINSKENSSIISPLKNQQNIHILKLLSHESLFDGYINDLIDIYQISLTNTIECVAVVIEQNSIEKYLFIKLSNDNIDTYQMNKTKSLKETFWKINEPISIWNTAGKQLEYYRRFIQDIKNNEIMINDQLIEIQNRPKLNDVHFFDMMGQILRIKYHIDPSSLSCILEVFFGNIYTCDGRLVYSHELILLSDDNDLFVFYAVMMDTTTEKQIYPLGINNHIQQGDQIFFLYNNHPQFNSLSSLACTDCVRHDQPHLINIKQEKLEQITDKQIVESKPIINPEQSRFNFITIPQNHIVYVAVTSLLVYILMSIYLSRKQGPSEYLARKQSISSRRGR